MGRVFHAPVSRQGGPGQDAASCSHTCTLTHTHTTHTHTPLPALVLGGGQNNLLNKDSAGKLPSVSQWSLPPITVSSGSNCRQGCQHEKGQWWLQRLQDLRCPVECLRLDPMGSAEPWSGRGHRRDKINLSWGTAGSGPGKDTLWQDFVGWRPSETTVEKLSCAGSRPTSLYPLPLLLGP